MRDDRIIVIGAGQAGAACAAKLRALGHEGSLTLIGEETAPPYQRPPLSKKYLLGEMSRERLYLKPESFYAEAGIELRLGVPVTAIDRTEAVVMLDDERLPYDRLVLATGAVPRRLPARTGGDLDGVFSVRTVSDVDAMAPEFEAGRRLLIVGGGYIGLEAAAVATSRGLEVTLIEQAPRILQRVAAPETSNFFRVLHASKGVKLREEIGLSTLLGENGRITGAKLSDGEEIGLDFAIVGIGVDPATGLAESADLLLDNGIAVDSHGRTNDPRIYAAGDCASFPFRSGRVRLESVQNAIDQAEHVAAAILGETTPYAPVPWFWSDQYECRLQIAGLNSGYDRVVLRPGHRAGGQSVWYFARTTLLAVDAMNDPRAYMQGKRWLEAGISPDAERLGTASTDLKALA